MPLLETYHINEDGIRIFNCHPYYYLISRYYPRWARLKSFPANLYMHEHANGPDCYLEFGTTHTGQYVEWDKVFHDLCDLARTAEELYSNREKLLEIGDLQIFLSRHVADASTEGYKEADLSFNQTNMVVNIPALTIEELKEIGTFIFAYAESMEVNDILGDSGSKSSGS